MLLHFSLIAICRQCSVGRLHDGLLQRTRIKLRSVIQAMACFRGVTTQDRQNVLWMQGMGNMPPQQRRHGVGIRRLVPERGPCVWENRAYEEYFRIFLQNRRDEDKPKTLNWCNLTRTGLQEDCNPRG